MARVLFTKFEGPECGSVNGTALAVLGKPCLFAAWSGLFLAAVTPPHGAGFTVCWLKASTGIPCPGCGLTRSLSCALRGMFMESWQYHPMARSFC